MILVTGANGQLGQCFRQLASIDKSQQWMFVGSDELDISDTANVRRFFDKHPDIKWCINCAAYTAVDQAESERDAAHRVNAWGPAHLAKACAKTGAFLIHFSTDYVYHYTSKNKPIREVSPTKPEGVYARSKIAGEQAAQKLHLNGTMIIRTSWLYAAHGNNFVKTMLRLGVERESISVVYDQVGSPTYAPDLAATVMLIIARAESGHFNVPEKANPTVGLTHPLAGIWHYSNEGVASWYDFAHAIFQIKNMDCHVQPILSKEYPTPAVRPAFSVLDKTKIKTLLDVEIPHWRDSLERCLAQL
jgi:dTDP-4-dehydrorhamnose reductase